MDYNQFTYYRANPYANLGFMPPRAQVNRHKPDFLTELPMGQQHLEKIGKRQFFNNAHKSNIETDSILKSPERYPYENRIALDKQYQHIEGASGGTLMSQAVRNKMKARQEIIRRQQQSNINNKNLSLISGQKIQQQKRRRIALQQYIRDQQNKQMVEKQKSQIKKNQPNQQQLIRNNSLNKKHLQKNQNQYYVNNRKSRLNDQDSKDFPRHQSIDLGRIQENPKQMQNQQNFRNPPSDDHRRKNSDISTSRYDYKQRQQDKNRFSTAESGKELHYVQFANNRKSLRQQNPTYLSSEGSTLYMAAKNFIKGE